MDIAKLADLLHETADHHDHFEKIAPPHDWWDWYAPYLDAREHGSTPDEAVDAANLYMKEVRQFYPDDFERLSALSELVSRWVRQWTCRWR